jgi:hypothetical protein
VHNQDLIYSGFGLFLLAQALSCGTVGWIVPNLTRLQRYAMFGLTVVLGTAGVISMALACTYHQW